MKTKFDIYTTTMAGNSIGGSAIIVATAEDGRSHQYEISKCFGNTPRNRAAIAMAALALATIKEHYYGSDVRIVYYNNYVGLVLSKKDDGSWKITPRTYVDFVEKIREIAGDFNITLESSVNNPKITECLKLSKITSAVKLAEDGIEDIMDLIE